jgi:hypothetical protein
METVLTEQHFQEKSGLTDRNTMAALRSATNARFVLAGTISRLGTTNLFDVKILDIETGRQVENGGAYRQYTNLADGIGLMGELAYELTGKEAGRYAENRQQERLAADAERTQWEAQRKQQNEENFKNAVAEFFFGEQRFTSLGVNAGIGFGQDENKNRNSNDPFYQNTETLNFNGFVNINATIPLVWYLFAEAGMDIGFAGSIGDRYYARYEGNQDDNKETFSLTRPYARLNIGIPFGDRDFLAFLYTGVGFGWTNASYQYMQDSYYDFDGGTSVPSSKQTTSIEYSAADLVFGCFVSWGHHGMRFSINLNNISKSEYFEMQMSAGYVFRF